LNSRPDWDSKPGPSLIGDQIVHLDGQHWQFPLALQVRQQAQCSGNTAEALPVEMDDFTITHPLVLGLTEKPRISDELAERNHTDFR